MPVALKQPSRSLALRPTLSQSTALSSKSEQQVSGAEPVGRTLKESDRKVSKSHFFDLFREDRRSER